MWHEITGTSLSLSQIKGDVKQASLMRDEAIRELCFILEFYEAEITIRVIRG